MLGLCLVEADLVYREAALKADVTSHFQRHAVGCLQVEANGARQHRTASGGSLFQSTVKLALRPIQRGNKLLFFQRHGAGDEVAAVHQLRVDAAHLGDDGFAHLGQEGARKADLAPVAESPANDQAQHIAGPGRAGAHAVRDQKGGGAGMVGDDAIAGLVLLALHRGVTQERLDPIQDRREKVRLIVDGRILHDADDAFEAHARVDAGLGQRRAYAVGILVVLHEHQVPDLQPAPTAVVEEHGAGGRVLPSGPSAGAGVLTPIEVNLARGAAWTDITHRPEIGLVTHTVDALRRNPEIVGPHTEGEIIVLMDRVEQALRVQTHGNGQELVGEANGFTLEVVTKAEIAQHLEQGVMPG